jgi:hypothetical protein
VDLRTLSTLSTTRRRTVEHTAVHNVTANVGKDKGDVPEQVISGGEQTYLILENV